LVGGLLLSLTAEGDTLFENLHGDCDRSLGGLAISRWKCAGMTT
jgi:hypothetical protein